MNQIAAKPVKAIAKSISLLHYMPEFIKKCDKGSMSHYCFIDAKGVYHQQANDVCFARFAADPYAERGTTGIIKARVFVNQHLGNKYEAEYIEWAKYITQESPYRFAFLNRRNLKQNFAQGFPINCKAGASYTMAAMTALREGYEYPAHRSFWTHLVGKGINKDKAFFLASFLAMDVKDGVLYDQTKGGHGAIPQNMHLAETKKFLTEGLPLFLDGAEPPLCKRSAQWRVFQIHDLKGAYGVNYNDRDAFVNAVLKKCKTKKVKKGWNENDAFDEAELLSKFEEWIK